MNATRQFWAVVAIATTLLFGGVVLARPVLVVGAAMIGAWLVAQQYAFVLALNDTMEAISIDQELVHDRIVTDRPTPLSIGAVLEKPTQLSLLVEPGIPIGAQTERDVKLSLSPNRKARDVIDVSWPISGTFEFNQASIHVQDPIGLFEQTLSDGATPSVTVEPRGPRNVHIGKGGERLRQSFGEHQADPLESGMDPEEIRKYVSGDAARIIDWKSTARMGYPHVREFESETDRKTVLLMDQRTTMNDGPEGETKFDYARHVALSLVEQVQERTDPLGLYAVDDTGVTDRLPPRSSNQHYAAVRSRLHELAVKPGDALTTMDRDRWSAARTRALATLDDDGSPFATRLRPYAGSLMTDTQTIENEPLTAAIRTHIQRLGSGTWTVLITDDSHRAEVREAVLLARHRGDRVLVMLTPTVLFESGGFTDLSAAYNAYSEFESFRRSLDRLERVSAVEVAPGDRLSVVQATGRRERRAAT